MNKRHETALADYKARQLAGEHMTCPRCGQFTMKSDLHTNALSRHADIYVCDSCGTEEAMLVFMNSPMPMSSWAALMPKRPASDFKVRCSTDVLSEIVRVQVPLLIEIYQQMLRGELDSEDVQYEAYSKCPGLTALWLSPFHAKYDTADGQILIRFRKRSDEIEYCTSAFAK